VLPEHQLRPLLLGHPEITLRMLEAMARRLRATTLWAG
jgi:CRP-like cAMP-binding protein